MANTESKKPFDLHLVMHAPNQGEQLVGLEHYARQTLNGIPDGKRIVVFTEHGRLPMQVTNKVTKAVLHGKSPRAALLDTMASFNAWRLKNRKVEDIDAYKDHLDEEIEYVEREHGRGFLGASTEMIGRLTSEFPGRVLWTPEGQTHRSEVLTADEIVSKKNVWEKITETREERAARRKLLLVYQAELMREREVPNANVVAQYLAKDEQAAGFGWMGADHEGFGLALEEAGGIEVHRTYPLVAGDMHGIVSPRTELALRLRIDPDAEVTDDEITALHGAEKAMSVISGLTMKPLVHKIIAPFSGDKANAERYRRADGERLRRERRSFDNRLKKLREKSGDETILQVGQTVTSSLDRQVAERLLKEAKYAQAGKNEDRAPKYTDVDMTVHDLMSQEPQIGESSSASIAQLEEGQPATKVGKNQQKSK